MTDHKALTEAIERDRDSGTPGPWRLGSWQDNVFGTGPKDEWLSICRIKRDDAAIENSVDGVDARRIARLPDIETAYLELWARVQALEGAIATHGAEACGILRAYHEEDGRRLWLALRAALQPPETDQ